MFANGPGDQGPIPGQVTPKSQKCYLIPPCLTLSIIRYKSRVKWCNPGKRVLPSPTSRCCSYWKGSLRVALDYGHQLYFYLYILNKSIIFSSTFMHNLSYIYMCVCVCVCVRVCFILLCWPAFEHFYISCTLVILWTFHLTVVYTHTYTQTCPGMTLNCIRWWGSCFGALGSREYPIIAITYTSPLILTQGSHTFQRPVELNRSVWKSLVPEGIYETSYLGANQWISLLVRNSYLKPYNCV